jgi:hypothetical protein
LLFRERVPGVSIRPFVEERSFMDKSVAELNIEHYRKLLASADLDEAKRKTVETLLAAEQEKLAQIKSERAAA